MNKRIYAFLVVFTLLNTSSLLAANGKGIGPEHDDGPYTPVPVGVEGTACDSGVSAGYPCKNIELLSRLPLQDIGGGAGADSWGWKDEENGRYYALMARSNGVSFIDVTNPQDPVYLGNLPSESGEQPWRDVKTYENYAFVVADNIQGHGMQVFDLTRLRSVTAAQQFAPDATYKEFGPAHNIAINEDSGFAYVAGTDTCNGGLHMVDLRQPLSPQNAGCFSGDGYTHDVHCVTYEGPDDDHAGSEICLASNEDSLTIVDVSNKQRPVMLSKLAYPDVRYAHQGWLTDDQRYFILGDELDERNFGSNVRTRVFFVGDLDSPQYMGAHLGGTSTIDHNLYVRGPYLFQANYQAGLRILLMEDLARAQMQEVAYFDTYPARDSREFSGAWNVYPFFDNGTILVSDMQSGLFVLQAVLPGAAAESSPINGQLSGAFVADGLNDQGLMLFVGENNTGPFAFFSWFLYRDGVPFWVAGNAAYEYGAQSLNIPTQRLEGLELLAPSDAMASRQNIGFTHIHKHSCEAIHVTYDWGELGSGVLHMKRLVGIEGRRCADNGQQQYSPAPQQ